MSSFIAAAMASMSAWLLKYWQEMRKRHVVGEALGNKNLAGVELLEYPAVHIQIVIEAGNDDAAPPARVAVGDDGGADGLQLIHAVALSARCVPGCSQCRSR